MSKEEDEEKRIAKTLERLKANPDIRWNDDGTATLSLKWPFEWGKNSEPVTEVRIRRPRAKEVKIIQGDAERTTRFIGAITGWTEAQVEELDAFDYDLVGDIALVFMKTSGRTGVSGSER